MTTLNLHSIESFGTHDGPGIRIILFLQGCKFRCLYCHNPDTIPIKKGDRYEIDDLVDKVLNLKSYFGDSGGITLSGGEPLLQSKALITLFKRLKEEGIHTNIDTNGRVLDDDTKELLDNYTDLVMLDIKHFDQEWHKKLTGVSKEFSFRFAEYRENSGKDMWLRYVLVPGWSDQPEYLHALGKHFQNYKTIKRFEIQPYHKLGIHKWISMGWKYELENVQENTDQQIADAVSILKNYFPNIVVN